MTYTKEDCDRLAKELEAIQANSNRIMSSYVLRDFKNPRAREFATHGFPRRIKLLAHCIELIFEDLPPGTDKPPNSDEILDVTIYLQAFVFNVFGCTDNLAHIWAREQDLKKEDGKLLENMEIGFFGPRCGLVLDSLPGDFSDYLKGLEPWFEYLGNFRHALAHRIPPYIPPFYVPKDKLQEYEEIGNRIGAAIQQENYDEVVRLENEQTGMVLFSPIVTHSFGENAKKVFFHSQMLSDFNTVVEIAQKLLKELGNTNDA